MILVLKPQKRDYWNRCTICGKFIAIKDFESGEATSEMVYPDSELTVETFEVICKKCKQKEKGNES